MSRTENKLSSFLKSIGKPIFFVVQILTIFVYLLIKIVSTLPNWVSKKPSSKIIKKHHLPKKRVQKKSTLSITISLSKGFLIFIGFTSFISTFIYLAIIKDLPSPQDLNRRDQIVTTKILDRNGELLYKIFKNENRSLVSLEEIPTHVINATIAIEDQDFYQHAGVSLKGISRAIKRNLIDKKVQGGSTITQQLVKNTLLTSEKTYVRKIKEVILAIGVELTFTKNQILTMYFNQVGYGGAIYGIEEASQYYFGKSIKNTSLAESALLAGLPASPTIYSPYGANPELALVRQHEVLRRMVEEGYITKDESENAKSEKLEFQSPKNDIHAPHFVMYIKNILVEKYGEAAVHQGGLSVTTSLDINIQKMTEEIIDDEIKKIKNLNITNAAAIVLDPITGEILAMIGSVDYFDIVADGQVNVVTRPRQPGSSIKPLTYALAFENTFSPSSTIDDTPITYRTPGSPPYSPINYDGRFHGKVTLRQALANSYNVPAVKLLSHLGVNNLVNFAQKMGITTWTDSSRFGLSLTLGGGEIKMIDLASAYSIFANQGKDVTIQPILNIYDYKKRLLFSPTCLSKPSEEIKKESNCPSNQVISIKTAYQISDILSDNIARSNTFGLHSKLVIPGHQVAVKTGTTNNLRDNWTIGYTNKYLVAVWVGNNNNSPMSGVASGVTGATPIWNRIMTSLLTNQQPSIFKPQDNLVKVSICPLTQTLVCAACPNPVEEYFVKGEEPTLTCNKEMIDKLLHPPIDKLPRNQILEGSTTFQ